MAEGAPSTHPAQPEAGAADTSGAYKAALQYCQPFRDRYDKCFDNWYRQGFLKGQLNNTCDDFFEDYKACVLEEMAARGLKFGGLSSVPPELRR
mmetsp:Transcript_965/g.2421  ORF Transcript_965/g.2421 Transcript_965/m.2421 type:complete len:94 (-) Transcript_965:73-354(-)